MSLKKYQRLEFMPIEDEFLIEKVKENPPLYVRKLKTYKDVQLRDSIWRKIQKEMKEAGYDRSAEDCKKRWTNLRDYYTRRKRVNTTGSSAHEIKDSLKNLQFLDENTLIHRATKSNITSCSIEFREDEATTQLSNYTGPTYDDRSPETESHTIAAPITTATAATPTIASTSTASTATTSTIINNIENSVINTRKRTRSQVIDSMEEGREERMELLRQIVHSKQQQSEDHIDIYFKSLAAIAKTWSPLYYAKSRGKIGNLINDLDIKYLLGNVNSRTEEDDSE